MQVLFLIFVLAASVFSHPSEKKGEKTQYEFSADVGQMMKILINSLYSNKDIFLRELISNCADAMNKVKYESTTNPAILGEGDAAKLDITLIPDEDEDTLTIIDRGIGMNRDELITNLGTLAQSGTLRFLEASTSNVSSSQDLIGQFGVGFYSAFLVAKKVEVRSKRYNESQYIWTSNGETSFSIEEDLDGEDLKRGTSVKLFLNEFIYANTTKIRDIANKFSEFIDFPIYLRVEEDSKGKSHYKEPKRKKKGKDADDDLDIEIPDYKYEHINTNKAIWLRDPKEVKEDEYKEFFKSVSLGAGDDPLDWSHFHHTVDCDFRTILYIPKKPPSGSLGAGGGGVSQSSGGSRLSKLKLYIKRVLITEDLEDFLPRYMEFVRGVVDSDDLPLNVSREMLQESKTLK
ncbi:MAG: putative Hsp90 protein, partial [Streblomastix strix]